jgi:hypothetical protein
MAGAIGFTNTSATPCSMAGYLDVKVKSSGVDLPVEVVHLNSTGESASTDSSSAPVVLAPAAADASTMFVQWMNWCGTHPTNITVEVIVDSDPIVVSSSEPNGLSGVPRCDTSDPSRLFERPVAHKD